MSWRKPGRRIWRSTGRTQRGHLALEFADSDHSFEG
jgi:hypothetical protein